MGTQDGRVVALGRGGEPEWTFQAEDAVLSVCVAGQAGDDSPPVAVGANDRRLYLLEEGGEVRWSHRFEIFRGGWAWYTRNSSVEAGEGRRPARRGKTGHPGGGYGPAAPLF